MKIIVFIIFLCTFHVESDGKLLGKKKEKPHEKTSLFNILAVFPLSYESNWIFGSPLVKGLADNGHNLTVIGAYKPPLSNNTIKFIEITGLLNYGKCEYFVNYLLLTLNKILILIFYLFKIDLERDTLSVVNMSRPDALRRTYDHAALMTNFTMRHEKVVRLIRSNKGSFDLIIIDMFFSESTLAFSARYGAPVVALSTIGSSTFTKHFVDTPHKLSCVTHPFSDMVDRQQLSLIERAKNIWYSYFDYMYYIRTNYNFHSTIYESLFEVVDKSLSDIIYHNVALVLLNTHFSIRAPRPLAQAMIEVGGMHLTTRTFEVPHDIYDFMETAPHNFIYISLGIGIKISEMPKQYIIDILYTLALLKQRVLFKYEGTGLDNYVPLKNIMIRKWFPQQAVFSHSKIRGFVTAGGQLSVIEAIYHGVPMICIPFFNEQHQNCQRIANWTTGIIMNSTDFNATKLIFKIVSTFEAKPRFLRNARHQKSMFTDRQRSPLETAIFWSEYVARYKGAHQLLSRSKYLNYFQYHNIDVYSIMACCLMPIIYIIYKLIVCLCNCCKRNRAPFVYSPGWSWMPKNPFSKTNNDEIRIFPELNYDNNPMLYHQIQPIPPVQPVVRIEKTYHTRNRKKNKKYR